MKRTTSIILVVGLLVGVLAAQALAAPVTIGISKFVAHPALDAVEQGIIDTLSAAGYERDVDVTYLLSDAQADMGVTVTIAQNFQAQDVDIVVAIATPSALSAAQVYEGSDTPLVFAAVTDPLGAGLIISATDPSLNGNITGVSDLIPVGTHLSLLKELSADIVNVGIVYNPGEPNSVKLTELAIEAAPGLGLTIVTASADSTANVPLAAQSLVGRVDAYYVTTDNTVVSAIDSVLAASEEAGVPFLMADPTSLASATMAAGFDYYVHGQAVGEVLLELLGGKTPSEVAPVYQAESEVHLNLDAALRIGLEFPMALIQKATSVLYGDVIFAPKAE